MTPEQKQRAKAIVFEHESDIATAFSRAFALVQDIAKAQIAPEQAVGVPDGWKLVPEKPTVDMIVDGLNARYIGGGCDEGTMARRMYTALLAAAPEAPAPSVPDWLETTQFLTDVTTAAGLLAYGRRDKGLAQRIGDFAHKYRMLAAAPAARKLA